MAGHGGRFAEMVGLDLPVVQAPMIGPRPELAAAVSEAGGLGSLGCAAMTGQGIRDASAALRARTDRPFNLNFFCHAPAPPDPAREAAWRARLAPAYAEYGLDPAAVAPAAERAPFGDAQCEAVEEVRPRVVSFHFGLPDERLLRRVRDAGCLVLSTATTVREARWLAERGVDAVIAQGAEAGGHRGMFLAADPAAQLGTVALVPRVADAVRVPVVAAGGIADARGVRAAFALGADAVQVGTAYLRTPEALTTRVHRAALADARDDATRLTNLFSGRPARGLLNRLMREQGPLSGVAPAFPTASTAVGPLRAAAEGAGSGDFSPLWAGEAAALAQDTDAEQLTRELGAIASAAAA